MAVALKAAGLWPEDLEGESTALFSDEEFTAFASGPKAMTQYQSDPIGFFRDVLGMPESTIRWSKNAGYRGRAWDGTPDPLVAIAEALADWQDVGVESATGTGKSFEAALLVYWFLAVWEGARVFSFAPKEDQLRLYMWAEISKLWPRFQRHFPTAELSDLRIRMDGTDNWAAFGYSVAVGADEQVATSAQGMHAEHMLLIYEETPGIHPAVMAAGEHTCTAPHNLRLALGNPDNQLDTLHQFCTKPGVVHVRVSALDHPNVVTGDANLIPGAASAKSVERRRVQYGEGSPQYESRIRGISPAQATDSLVRLEWLQQAQARYLQHVEMYGPLTGTRAKGVDVANSENGDKAAIADGIDQALVQIRAFPCPDANKLGTLVATEITRDKLDPTMVGVDPVGVGAGTVNELARLGKQVQRLGGGERPMGGTERAPDGSTYEWAPDANSFNNLRSQMYWQFREDARLGQLMLSPEAFEILKGQATIPRFSAQGGKTVVESKKEIKRRTGTESPNELDAAVYWNWVRPRALAKPTDTAHPEDVHPGFLPGTAKRKESPRPSLTSLMQQNRTPARPFQMPTARSLKKVEV